MRRTRVLIAALVGMTWPATLAAQERPAKPATPDSSVHAPSAASLRYRFRLLGVYDESSGEPIPDVEVSDALSGAKSLTTATGTVSLFFLPDGGSLVRLRKVGYEVQTLPVAIAPSDTTPITIVLRKLSTLATVQVNAAAVQYHSPKLQAAAARMASGMGGHFVDEATMRKNDNSTVANVIRSRLPGLMSVTGRHGETYFVSTRQMCKRAVSCTRPDCYVTLYIDGIQSTVLPDYSRLSPEEYAMAEFYPGGAETPPEYGGTQSPCGALLLWTRER